MKQKEQLFSYGIITLIGIIYLLTQSPHPGFGDSLGFLLFASKGFDWATNATSHFLYANFNHIAISLFPFINPIRVLTFISILSSLICAYILYKSINLVSKNQLVSRIVVVFMALSFTWWRQSVMIEVYTFYSIWVLSSFYFMLKDMIQSQNKHSVKVGVFLGLAILTHIQAILFLPLYAFYLFSRKKIEKKLIFFSVISFLVIISPLFLLPILLKTHNLSSVFFDNQYKDAVLAFNIIDFFKGGIRSLGYLLYNFHVFSFFIFHGVFLAWKNKRILCYFGFLAAGPIWGFAMRYTVTDNYVFFIIPYFVLCLFGAMSVEFFLKKINQKRAILLLSISLLSSPLVYFSAWQIAEQIPKFQAWAESKTFKGGLAYYLWPGQSQSVDPLSLAEKIYKEEIQEIPEFERYPVAVEYLKATQILK